MVQITVVDIPTVDDVEPLPNLDYKLMCGDSLISTINGEQLIPDPNKDKQQLELNVTPVQAAIQPLVNLQRKYFASHADERKVLREEIVDAEKNVFREAIADRRQYWDTEQRKLEEDIKRLKGKASRTQTSLQQTITAKLRELSRIEADVEQGVRSLNFFQWHLHFNEVFQHKGGFDIIIGNPPYGVIFNENIKKAYELIYPVFKRNNDIYTAFYQQGLFLLKNKGYFSYISPNTFLNGDYFEFLREEITKKTKINYIIDYKNIKIFDDPTVFVCVVILNKLNRINYPYNFRLLTIQENNDTLIEISKSSISALKEQNRLFNRLTNPDIFYSLNDLFFVKDVGFNYWTKGRGKKRGEDSIGKRVFYKGKQQHQLDIPFLKGSNIQKWHYTNPSNYLKHNYQELLNTEIDTLRFSANFLEQKLKIIYRQTASQIIATIDTNSFYLDKTVHLIVSRKSWDYISPYALLGILNSKLMAYLYAYISQEITGRAFPQVKTTYIKKIPIPKNLNSQDQNLVVIANLVQECLDAKGQCIEDWEAEIDNRVAHLYGLTAEEIAQINGQ